MKFQSGFLKQSHQHLEYKKKNQFVLLSVAGGKRI